MDDENHTLALLDASVEGFDEDALARNDTLVSLYANWPYCSSAIQPANGSLSNASIGEPDARLPVPLFEFVTSLFLLVVVAVPGIVGNLISIFILSRPQMRSSLNVILIGNQLLASVLIS